MTDYGGEVTDSFASLPYCFRQDGLRVPEQRGGRRANHNRQGGEHDEEER